MFNITKTFNYLTGSHSNQNNNPTINLDKLHQEILDYELAQEQNVLSEKDKTYLISLYRNIINHYATNNDQKYKLFEKKLIKILLTENQPPIKKGSAKCLTQSNLNQSFEVRMTRQQIQTFINDRKNEQEFVNKLVQNDISKQQNSLYSRLVKRNSSIQPKNDNSFNLEDNFDYNNTNCYQSQKNVNSHQNFQSVPSDKPSQSTESSHSSIQDELEQLEHEKNMKIEQVVKDFNTKIEKMRGMITQSLDQNIINKLHMMEKEKLDQIQAIEQEYERIKEQEFSIE